MLSDVLKIYEHEEKYLVLNPTVPAWIVTDINGVLAVKCYAEANNPTSAAEAFCQKLDYISPSSILKFYQLATERQLFTIQEPYTYGGDILHSVYFNMSASCNFSCSYFFAEEREEFGEGKLTYEDYQRILDAFKKENYSMTITFTGGEPLISPLSIPVANYAKNLGFETFLLTNGSLITKDNVGELLEAFDHFKISIDGSTPELFGKYRGVENYSKVMQGIELLTENKADVAVAMVVTKDNVHDTAKMTEKWGSRLNFMPLFPMGNALTQEEDKALTGEEYYTALSQDARIEPFSDIINILTRENPKPIMKCAMGNGEVSISATGDVYPCQLLHKAKYLLGNVHETDIITIITSDKAKELGEHTVEKIAKCKNCDVRYICGGACQARHESETGSIDEVGEFCSYEKMGIIRGIINHAKIMELD